MRIHLALAALTAALASLAACGDDSDAAEGGADSAAASFGLPEMIRPEGYSLAKADLGKMLFFDTRLSSNGSMSCSTCHQHEKGWTDGIALSTKVDGSTNTRNSPSLYNVGYQSLYYWDGRAPSLEANIGAAWKGHMGGDPDAMAATLAGVEGYATAFEGAFGAAPTGDAIVEALASFVRSLQSGGTAYDRWANNETSALTPEEDAGRALFFGKGMCIACHIPPLFTDHIFHNAGIGMDAESPDLGRYNAEPEGEKKETSKGAFKTPSLRNVTKTAPYFHNGSVTTLESVVRTMTGGGIANAHKDPLLADRSFDDLEIVQLMAFLGALESKESFTPPELPK